jgi:hypothetical protein
MKYQRNLENTKVKLMKTRLLKWQFFVYLHVGGKAIKAFLMF